MEWRRERRGRVCVENKSNCHGEMPRKYRDEKDRKMVRVRRSASIGGCQGNRRLQRRVCVALPYCDHCRRSPVRTTSKKFRRLDSPHCSRASLVPQLAKPLLGVILLLAVRSKRTDVGLYLCFHPSLSTTREGATAVENQGINGRYSLRQRVRPVVKGGVRESPATKLPEDGTSACARRRLRLLSHPWDPRRGAAACTLV
jgi:hypothetical protein